MRILALLPLLALALAGCEEEPTIVDGLCNLVIDFDRTRLELRPGAADTLRATYSAGACSLVTPVRTGWRTLDPQVVLFQATSDSTAVVRAVGPGTGRIHIEARAGTDLGPSTAVLLATVVVTPP